MGRKNRNAGSRGYSYTSFDSLKNSTIQFDLSNANFISKTSGAVSATESVEIRVSFNVCGSKKDDYVNFSIREDIAKKMIEDGGKLWSIGLVKEGKLERLYFIPNPISGYSAYQNSTQSKRYYMRFPITGNKAAFEKYLGNHALKFDEYNKAFYLIANE